MIKDLFIGQSFDTPYEKGCKVQTLPDEQGVFEALDSEGVLCTFCLEMVESVVLKSGVVHVFSGAK